MKRAINSLLDKDFDVVVIGGGIYGACVAWEASLRGLSVALIEKSDLGAATSANSLKIVHGGLRYLQDGNLRRVRMMIRERRIWLRAAPHLVHPQPFLVPTNHSPNRHKMLFTAALALNDLIGFDRNRLQDPQKHLPRGHLISRKAFLRLLPFLDTRDVTGGAVWYDAIVRDTERLLLSIIRAASSHGAVVANYLKVTGFLEDEGVVGVTARDILNDRNTSIRARLVINCAGPWVDTVLERLNRHMPTRRFVPSLAINLVTRQIVPDYALGVPCPALSAQSSGADDNSRLLFIVPWRDYSLIGTWHGDGEGLSPDGQAPAAAILEFLDEINAAVPAARLSTQDVYQVHWGLLPRLDPVIDEDVKLIRESNIHDHAHEDNIQGLISVIGVKYTTARATAVETIDMAEKKLGIRHTPSPTARARVWGGEIERFEELLSEAQKLRPPELSAAAIEHLVYTYGSEYPRIVSYVRNNPHLGRKVTRHGPVIAAEVVHAVREEMAYKLEDIVRRMQLGSTGLPDEVTLHACARLMAGELGWDELRCNEEIESVRTGHMCSMPESAGARAFCQ